MKNTLLKIFKGTDFPNQIFMTLLRKVLQIVHAHVVMFSWIILLGKAVVAKKFSKFKLYFLHNSEGNHAPNHQCIRAICDHDLYSFKQDNTVCCQISSWYGNRFDNKLCRLWPSRYNEHTIQENYCTHFSKWLPDNYAVSIYQCSFYHGDKFVLLVPAIQ